MEKRKETDVVTWIRSSYDYYMYTILKGAHFAKSPQELHGYTRTPPHTHTHTHTHTHQNTPSHPHTHTHLLFQSGDDGVSGIGGLFKGYKVEYGLRGCLFVGGLLVREECPLKDVTPQGAQYIA